MHPRIERHEKLTIHPVHDTAVAGDDRSKVLDAVGTFNGTSEETTKRRNEARKEAEPNGMELNWVVFRRRG